jgi:hypothetical protein
VDAACDLFSSCKSILTDRHRLKDFSVASEDSKSCQECLRSTVPARFDSQLRALPKMPGNSPIPSCGADELSGMSTVDKILQIDHQDYATQETDSKPWMENLQCLSRKGHSKNLLELARFESRRFVAVSYPNEADDQSESAEPSGMKIQDQSGVYTNDLQVRKVVMERVLKYAGSLKVRHFWIDKGCIVQDSKDELESAMHAMHLVYGRSLFPVALLELTLGQSEADSLNALMTDPKPSTNPGSRLRMISMLERIRKDNWWKRAWTFQEEYHAALNLRILARLEDAVSKSRLRKLGEVEHEACIAATTFRKNATKFLLSVYNSNTAHEELKLQCEILLETFGKYNVLYQETDFADSKAMSATIFADLERRRLCEGREYDLLRITANVCDYNERLCSDSLAESVHSVGMCALTMYLMNGEIIHNDDSVAKPTARAGLSEYLYSISFDKFRPPSEVFELSWLKRCRLWPAEFSREGVITSGYLWRVHEKIETSGWVPVRAVRNYSKPARLRTYQRNTLNRLVDELARLGSHDTLRKRLVGYLDNDRKRDPSEARAYMNIMAEEVVEAIHSRRRLYLAGLAGSSHACAIFVLDPRDERSDIIAEAGSSEVLNSSRYSDTLVGSEIFTSWSDTVNKVTDRHRIRHVSLTVDVADTHGKPKVPLMTTTGWINGLAFYDNVSPKKAVFRWPEAWQSKSRKRRRSTESDCTDISRE